MLIPPQNVLLFRGFGYAVLDGKDAEGKPIKLLSIQDTPPTGINLVFVFSPEEFETFHSKTTESRIVPATELPKGKIVAG